MNGWRYPCLGDLQERPGFLQFFGYLQERSGFLDLGTKKEGHSGSTGPLNHPFAKSLFQNQKLGEDDLGTTEEGGAQWFHRSLQTYMSQKIVSKPEVSKSGVYPCLGDLQEWLGFLQFFGVPLKKKWVSWRGDQEGRAVRAQWFLQVPWIIYESKVCFKTRSFKKMTWGLRRKGTVVPQVPWVLHESKVCFQTRNFKKRCCTHVLGTSKKELGFCKFLVPYVLMLSSCAMTK